MRLCGIGILFASIRGFSFQHIYPAFPAVHAQVLMLSIPFLAMFSILFCMEFLRVRSHSPRLRAALIGMLIFEILYFLAVPFLDYKTGILLAAVSAFVFFSLLMIAGPVSWAAGVRAGIFFTVAWSPLTVGVMATAGRALGVFPENFFTNYAMQIGSGLEAFILTLALADRLYREREQKIKAQADILRQEKARRDAQDRLTYAMTHDPATGLPNRNRFEWMVDEQLQLNPGGSYMVGVARVTGLEEINRTLGLERSERLLKRLEEQMTMLAGHELFATALETYGLQAGDVIVELTETAAMDDPEKGLQALERLASSGLKVSIDDFGAGYSSLSYLKRLPANEIKLDRSLLQDICTSDSSRTIAETAITMGRSLGFLVVAEGVEGEASAQLLATLGADMLQGFWLCRPAPLESIKDWLLTSSSVV
ncbi:MULTISPECIES: EAL domain-containing protein [unclassified Marinobacter]|uniref:EAL domain-containing protein n=1 Tax=unclassified Marinobacter TaxID=83889 RepID=UPI001D0D4F1D|nr:EAL domain-containing protein [Marinobacter sp. LQ44]